MFKNFYQYTQSTKRIWDKLVLDTRVAGTIPKFMRAFLGDRLITKTNSTKLNQITMPQLWVFCVRNTENPSSFSYNQIA